MKPTVSDRTMALSVGWASLESHGVYLHSSDGGSSHQEDAAQLFYSPFLRDCLFMRQNLETREEHKGHQLITLGFADQM